ncbi:Ras-related protein Rab-3C [Oryzias melastigma]|uniref:Ras-related protein Rab-3 n=3 Tax=Oryzias TaxID=8089 RepID=A0A834FER2_ORYME|nr:Ras-related protein Rab-3C [Oryzias melastigma]
MSHSARACTAPPCDWLQRRRAQKRRGAPPVQTLRSIAACPREAAARANVSRSADRVHTGALRIRIRADPGGRGAVFIGQTRRDSARARPAQQRCADVNQHPHVSHLCFLTLWGKGAEEKDLSSMKTVTAHLCEPVQMAKADQRFGQRDGSDQNFDYMFKLLIIGNSSVGKTSFLFRYADDSFSNSFVSTVGIDFKVKTVYRNDKRIKLQIWDTAGQERYRTITTAYYRGAMGFILMYDITNEESFNAVQDWATQIKTYSWDNAQVIMVGNKCDMEEERVIPPEKGKHLADQLGFEYYEASAKENINVRQVFERLVDIICVKMSERVDVEAPAAPGTKTTRLTDKPAQLPQKCC